MAALTFGDMQTRIADELKRQDLTTAITRAIVTAIGAHEVNKFHFNEGTRTFNTVANQEYYDETGFDASTTLDKVLEIDEMTVVTASGIYPLGPKPDDLIESWQRSPLFTGTPQYFSYYGQKIRLFPVPQQVWSVRVRGTYRLAPVLDISSAATITNGWMTDGEAMVRSEAKGDIYLNQLKNLEMAKGMFEQAKYWESQLLRLAVSRGSSGAFIPSQF